VAIAEIGEEIDKEGAQPFNVFFMVIKTIDDMTVGY
jgi:hypothetical protein